VPCETCFIEPTAATAEGNSLSRVTQGNPRVDIRARDVDLIFSASQGFPVSSSPASRQLHSRVVQYCCSTPYTHSNQHDNNTRAADEVSAFHHSILIMRSHPGTALRLFATANNNAGDRPTVASSRHAHEPYDLSHCQVRSKR